MAITDKYTDDEWEEVWGRKKGTLRRFLETARDLTDQFDEFPLEEAVERGLVNYQTELQDLRDRVRDAESALYWLHEGSGHLAEEQEEREKEKAAQAKQQDEYQKSLPDEGRSWNDLYKIIVVNGHRVSRELIIRTVAKLKAGKGRFVERVLDSSYRPFNEFGSFRSADGFFDVSPAYYYPHTPGLTPREGLIAYLEPFLAKPAQE